MKLFVCRDIRSSEQTRYWNFSPMQRVSMFITYIYGFFEGKNLHL